MRCLGRLFLLAVVAVLLGVAWLFRDPLRQWAGVGLRPQVAATRTGRPSAAALRHALHALDSMQRTTVDSVIITPDETASLLARGAGFLPGVTLDSLSVQLGERSLDVRTVIDSARVPSTLRAVIPGRLPPYQALRVSGEFTPVRPGLGEFAVQGATVRGMPLPHALLREFIRRVTGRDSLRLTITLPAGVAGFRVRPAGMTIYGRGVP